MTTADIAVPELLSLPGLQALTADLERAERDQAARVWVLRGGTPAVFCRGMDLAGLGNDEQTEIGTKRFAACLHVLQTAPRPTVALIDGEALGGGLGLASACDLVLATERSTFGLPESLFGLLPALVMPILLERLRPQKARWLAMCGSSQGVQWAHQAGLVDERVTEEEAERVLQRHVRDLGRTLPGGARSLRDWVSEAPRLDRQQAGDRALELINRLVGDEEVRARVRAFTEEGVPPWTHW